MNESESIAVIKDVPDNLRIGMCQAVLRWTIEHAKQLTENRQLSGSDLILITIFVRSTRTYEAVVRCLGERSFGEQGLMLNRSLFEDMIDAHWVSINGELAVERLDQHDLYSRLLRVTTQRRFPRFFDGKTPPRITVSNEKRKELRHLYGGSGSRSWTGVGSLDDRVAEVEHLWPSREGREELLWWTAWVHKLSNEVLHPSAFSLGRLGSPTVEEDGSLQWHFGSTREWLPQALHGALWIFGQLTTLVIDKYNPSLREEFINLWSRAMNAFPEASEIEATGRIGR
jgi:hypothetical protein